MHRVLSSVPGAQLTENNVRILPCRFGKILWRNLPEDMLKCSWGIDKFADLCFSDTRHSRIFNPEYVLVHVYCLPTLYYEHPTHL